MRPIHPFPARMAPDLAKEKLTCFPRGSRILDPMCGSGTTLRHALNAGHNAVGWDIDPLAVKMSRTWCRRFDLTNLEEQTCVLREKLEAQHEPIKCRFSSCPETREFSHYWFAEQQRNDLNKLSVLIEDLFPPGRRRDFFQIAMSRIIVTKTNGASLAWDISHSRPHKKKDINDFQVIPEFFKSIDRLIRIFREFPNQSDASVKLQDCRKAITSEKFDVIITSPPYLNAIDYIRGHKFSLIWMGYTIPQLRKIRSDSIGVERGMPELLGDEACRNILKSVCSGRLLHPRVKKFLLRYIFDCKNTIERMRSLLVFKGNLIVVVGNSTQYGTRILNDKIFQILGSDLGLELVDSKTRRIRRQSRYLPITSNGNQISNRMKTETILHFVNA